MIAMNEPQGWTLIGVLATVSLSLVALSAAYFVRVMKSEIGGVRAEIGGLRGEMTAKFERVDAQFERVDAQFERVYDRLNDLDRDVQALTRHVFPDRD
jgi:hypothetical protein